MFIKTKNNKAIFLKQLQQEDIDNLHNYLQSLSDETKKRFGPHPFDKDFIHAFYNSSVFHRGYIAIESATNQIIAYAIIKIGFLEHDLGRLQSYGIILNQNTDCTFAPSIADDWQGHGLGNDLLQFIIDDLKQTTEVKRIVLWGGVQADNFRAVKYYENNGFTILGSFNYNGDNFDMIKKTLD